ncbi:MAG TPA: substrate-binding domain-containing protein [Thermoplasmata archaeon]|nr:substrate-binding domain-containing protein [Thermoplasmata archaeon]
MGRPARAMHFTASRRYLAVLLAAILVLVVVGAYLSGVGRGRGYLLMATTTSTRDTGLLPYLLPTFTGDTGIEVRYVAVGTGQALDAGRRGDVDVVMVHAPALEDRFMADGQGRCRNQVMYNRFVIVGPTEDPAGTGNSLSAADAFLRIYRNASLFESRADNSGTYNKELELWTAAGLDPATFGAWYERTDQGMGSTLTIADEKGAYTLSDDGTWYARESTLPYLGLLFSRNEDILRNRYSVIPVDPAAHPGVLFNEAVAFARWLVSPRGQGLIGAYAVGGHTIFTPDGNGTC